MNHIILNGMFNEPTFDFLDDFIHNSRNNGNEQEARHNECKVKDLESIDDQVT